MPIKTTRIGSIVLKRPSWEYQVITALSYAITSLFGGLPNYNHAQVKIPINDSRVYSINPIEEKAAGELEYKLDNAKEDFGEIK